MKVPKRILYPNSGEVFSIENYTWSGVPNNEKKKFSEAAEYWVRKQGVSVIGGCCRIGPEQITALRKKLESPIASKL